MQLKIGNLHSNHLLRFHKTKLAVKSCTAIKAYSISFAWALEEPKTQAVLCLCGLPSTDIHFISLLASNPSQVALWWAESVRQVVKCVLPWMVVCPANLDSSSTWRWMGWGSGAHVYPPVPGLTMACAHHTSTSVPVRLHQFSRKPNCKLGCFDCQLVLSYIPIKGRLKQTVTYWMSWHCRVQRELRFLLQWKFLHSLSTWSFPVSRKMWKHLSRWTDSKHSSGRMHRWDIVTTELELKSTIL